MMTTTFEHLCFNSFTTVTGGYGSFYGHGGGGYGHSVHAAVISHHNVKVNFSQNLIEFT